jgi:hypothetical protein
VTSGTTKAAPVRNLNSRPGPAIGNTLTQTVIKAYQTTP